MRPTDDQIQLAAYGRWCDRGYSHGYDRIDWIGAEKELLFHGHYRTIAHYPAESHGSRILGNSGDPLCRLCERGADETDFGQPYPALPTLNETQILLSAEVCSDCWAECLEPLARPFMRFRKGQGGLSLGAYKALVAAAILVMPARELGYFPDTIEWVNNPDPSCDATLFAGSRCRVYDITGSDLGAFVSLARRVHDDALVPYLVLLSSDGEWLIQLDVPLCLRDEDLDGVNMGSPERSLVWGHGADFREAACSHVELERQPHRPRAQKLGSAVRC
jgi:hypothetical protein